MKFTEHQEMFTAILNHVVREQDSAFKAALEATDEQMCIMLKGKSSGLSSLALYLYNKYPNHIAKDKFKYAGILKTLDPNK